MIYQLTKPEVEILSSKYALLSQYQQVLDALQLQFKIEILSGVFKRLNLSENDFQGMNIDLDKGEINLPDKKE